jgi:quinol monooxygenase YgiN
MHESAGGPNVAGSNPTGLDALKAIPNPAILINTPDLHERIAMYAAEFTLHAKPGHYAEVAALYSAFAADFLSDHPALESVMILGDEASGVVRGIGVFTDRPAADSVNSDPEFAAFNDAVAAMLSDSPKRVELELLHLFTGT